MQFIPDAFLLHTVEGDEEGEGDLEEEEEEGEGVDSQEEGEGEGEGEEEEEQDDPEEEEEEEGDEEPEEWSPRGNAVRAYVRSSTYVSTGPAAVKGTKTYNSNNWMGRSRIR